MLLRAHLSMDIVKQTNELKSRGRISICQVFSYKKLYEGLLNKNIHELM